MNIDIPDEVGFFGADELNKLITLKCVRDTVLEQIGFICEKIPELTASIGFKQNNPNHCYDVLNHILHSVDHAPKDVIIRLAMLFHDIGKPSCYTQSGDGIGHFYGHPQASSVMARDILTRLKYDTDTIEVVAQLVLYHDCEIRRRQHIKRWLNKIGEDRLRQLLAVKRADTMAQADDVRQSKLDVLDGLLVSLDEIIAQQQRFSLKDLAVNGRDLMATGVPQGVQVGVVLKRLMDMVIDEEVANDRDVLLGIALTLQ